LVTLQWPCRNPHAALCDPAERICLPWLPSSSPARERSTGKQSTHEAS